MANGKHDPGRLAAIVVSVAGYAISLVFNGLSVVGVGKFTSSLKKKTNNKEIVCPEMGKNNHLYSKDVIVFKWCMIYVFFGTCKSQT